MTEANVKKQKSGIETALPLSRIKTIMKSSLDTGNITNDVLFLMVKAVVSKDGSLNV